MVQRREVLLRLASASLLLGGGSALVACSKPKPSFNSVDITGVDYAHQFSLTDFNGQTRTLDDFKGKAVAMFFGYTQCPDVCPMTMGELSQVKQMMGDDGDKLQVLFVSVDPERDTPEVLKEYMGSFDPSFLALYASSPEKLDKLAVDFKIFYQKVESETSPGHYTVDHTAATYVYDPQGKLRLFSRYGADPKLLADDIRVLLKGA